MVHHLSFVALHPTHADNSTVRFAFHREQHKTEREVVENYPNPLKSLTDKEPYRANIELEATVMNFGNQISAGSLLTVATSQDVLHNVLLCGRGSTPSANDLKTKINLLFVLEAPVTQCDND